MCRDWGFRIEDIRKDLPVHLWYGRLDRFVPLNHGMQIAARLGGGNNVQLRVEDESHSAILFNWKRDIIQGLVSICEGQ